MLLCLTVIAGKKILLIEDNEDCRQLLAAFITRLGYHVVEANGVVQAIECAKTLRPDLITLDIALPRLIGYEVATALKADPMLAYIPIVVTTALVPGMYEERLTAVGAVEILYKPFELSKLDHLLRRYLPQEDATLQAPRH